MTDEFRADDRPAAAIREALDERRHGFGRPLADAAAEFRRRNGLVLGARSHAAAAFRVVVLPRADRDPQSLYDDRLDADPAAAFRWANAFLLALHRLEDDPESFAPAPKDAGFPKSIRQFVFEGSTGAACRTLFAVEDGRVDVLTVRGSTDRRTGR